MRSSSVGGSSAAQAAGSEVMQPLLGRLPQISDGSPFQMELMIEDAYSAKCSGHWVHILQQVGLGQTSSMA